MRRFDLARTRSVGKDGTEIDFMCLTMIDPALAGSKL
jgi:hypothetical protein